MSDTQPIEPASQGLSPAEQRLVAAYDELEALNRLRPGGMPPMAPPQIIEAFCRIEALAQLLIEKGVLTEDEFAERATDRKADQVLDFVRQVRELRQQALSRVVLPGSSQQV